MKKILLILILLTVGYTYAQDNYKIKNLDVNTRYSDFGVSYYGLDAVYASSKKDHNKSKKNWDNGQPFLELYTGLIIESGEIVDSEPLSDYIASKYHESNVCFTKDLKSVYFTRSNYYDKRVGKDSTGWNNLMIYKADVSGTGEFTNLVPMPFNDDHYSVGHPALSVDEKTLYFTSDMPGSMGQSDIFQVSINQDGSYGTPTNLGTQVNTKGKEMFPYVSKKNNLYFSSDGRKGEGGLDIYVVPLKSNAKPKNLGKPINSHLDDFSFIIDNDKKSGYFSSNRSGGHGDDDIYYFEELRAPEVECSQLIVGTARDKNTGALLPGTKITLYKGNEKIKSVVVGTDAVFSFPKMDCNTVYRVTGDKDLYDGDSELVTTTRDAKLKLDLSLNLAPKKKEIVSVQQVDTCQFALDDINTIFFDLDKYYIRPDAAVELDKIVLAMQRCPNIIVEARSHTDSRASHKYNENLSQKRAQSTVDYIIKHGIMSHRILAMGAGETRLVNHCSDGVKCSKKEHQENRRTEFVIVRNNNF